jgi:hypothetical protein
MKVLIGLDMLEARFRLGRGSYWAQEGEWWFEFVIGPRDSDVTRTLISTI